MSFLNSTAWVIITFLFFTALVAVISAWKTKGDNLESTNGYFLAGNGLPGIVIAGSLLLTNLSAEQLVGTNGQGWATNMSPMAFEVGSLFTLFALAYFFLPTYLRYGVTTMPELMEARFDRTTRLIFSVLTVIMYSILNLPVILYSGAVAFERIFDFSGSLGISRFMAVAILCVIIGIIGACYAIFGGLKAVAVSDTINGVGLLIGGLMVPFLALAMLAKETGGSGIIDGFMYMVQTEPSKLNAWAPWDAAQPALPWPLIFTGMFFYNLFAWCTHQSFVQRTLAAKSLAEGQKGAIFCGFLKSIGFFYLVLPGVIAYFLPSIQDTIAAAGSNAIDVAYPALIAAIIPKPVLGFFAAVLFGAILSSFNSVLNSASTMFALDIVKAIIKPDQPEVYYVKIAKRFGTLVAAIAICISPFIAYANGITTFLNSMMQFLGLPILTTIMGAIFFKRVPNWTPKVVTAFHIVVYALFLLISPSYPTNGEPVHYLYAMAVLFVVEIVFYAVLNHTSTAEEWNPPATGTVDMTPWKYRHVVCIIGAVLAVALYIFFSPIGIAG
ncbi:MAG: solute:sodium symporter family transporter [Eubacteriales bacterium]|nr:solute:sodium symporter family transporter [Eubacteriales bacterium]